MRCFLSHNTADKALARSVGSWITHPALPPMVCCPRCGETDTLVGWEDWSGDDHYSGLRCSSCKWEDGGEVS